MAAIKRKAEEKAAVKKPQAGGADRAAKRPRKEEAKEESKPAKSAAKESSTQKPLAKVSILQQEEKAFPRGGGSVLTPLEHKQIQIQATRDVLFEESGQKRSTEDGAEDGEDFGDAPPEEDKKATKKRKNKKSGKTTSAEEVEKRLKVEGLKFKRLSPGALILGQVAHIGSQELTLDLPNNLTGTVPITNVSFQLTKKLEAVANADDTETTDVRRYCPIWK